MNKYIILLATVYLIYLIYSYSYINLYPNKFYTFRKKWRTKKDITAKFPTTQDGIIFSKITNWDTSLFPGLSNSNPYHVVLKGGDAIRIPKGWWHWVRTTEPSCAVNYWWLGDKIYEKPTVFKKITDEGVNVLNRFPNEKVTIWDSYNDKTHDTLLYDFYKESSDFKYLITVEVESKDVKLKNGDYIRKYIPDPEEYELDIPKNSFKNLWMSSGKHETRLHKDDTNGILVLLYGCKEILLFAPNDSEYLEPIKNILG